jgi:PAS domain-containing protein
MAENGAVQNELTLRQIVDGISAPLAVMTPEGAVENRQPPDSGLFRQDARRTAVHVQGLPVRDANGRILRWCGLQTDIDEQKRAQEALRASERELRQIVDSVPGMIAVANSAGQQEYANRWRR